MKVLYVATVVKNHIVEFHIPYLKMLKEMGWETAVAARNDYENTDDCVIPYCDTFYDIPFERNPFKLGNINAYKKLKNVIDKGEYDVIHCHTPVGAMLARLAAQDARKSGTKVFYTAHGFHFYKGAPLINWLLFYPAERILAHKTDVLITIVREDYKRALSFKAKKVVYLHGVGVDLNRFKKASVERAKELKKELKIPDYATVLLSVGEVNSNKNHKVIIEALPEFQNVWFVLCGRGPLINEHKKLAERLGVGDRVIMTGYRNDVELFYKMADIFIIPSLREGLPVALMEAMSAGLICVSSKNRGANDLLEGSSLLFTATDVNELKSKLREAMNGDYSAEVTRNYKHLQSFELSIVLEAMKSLYLEAINT